MKSEIKTLKNKKEFLISPTTPFHFVGLKIENKGKTQKPKIKVSVFYNKNISAKEIRL